MSFGLRVASYEFAAKREMTAERIATHLQPELTRISRQVDIDHIFDYLTKRVLYNINLYFL